MKPRLLFLIPLLLAACGFKGPLSLPQSTPAAKPASSSAPVDTTTPQVRKAQETQ